MFYKRTSVLVFPFIVILICLTACNDNGPRNEKEQYIFDHLDDFVVVKDYITEQYSSELPTTVVLYNFFETNKDAPDSIVNSMKVVAEDDSSIKSFGVGRGYDFIYASKDYVVFWTDETLQDGLLYSENIRSAVKSARKKYYDDLQYHILDENWAWVGYNGL